MPPIAGPHATLSMTTLEGILNTRENRGTFTPVTDIDIPHHKRFGDATKAQATDRMEMAERTRIERVKDPPELAGVVHFHRKRPLSVVVKTLACVLLSTL